MSAAALGLASLQAQRQKALKLELSLCQHDDQTRKDQGSASAKKEQAGGEDEDGKGHAGHAARRVIPPLLPLSPAVAAAADAPHGRGPGSGAQQHRLPPPGGRRRAALAPAAALGAAAGGSAAPAGHGHGRREGCDPSTRRASAAPPAATGLVAAAASAAAPLAHSAAQADTGMAAALLNHTATCMRALLQRMGPQGSCGGGDGGGGRLWPTATRSPIDSAVMLQLGPVLAEALESADPVGPAPRPAPGRGRPTAPASVHGSTPLSMWRDMGREGCARVRRRAEAGAAAVGAGPPDRGDLFDELTLVDGAFTADRLSATLAQLGAGALLGDPGGEWARALELVRAEEEDEKGEEGQAEEQGKRLLERADGDARVVLRRATAGVCLLRSEAPAEERLDREDPREWGACLGDVADWDLRACAALAPLCLYTRDLVRLASPPLPATSPALSPAQLYTVLRHASSPHALRTLAAPSAAPTPPPARWSYEHLQRLAVATVEAPAYMLALARLYAALAQPDSSTQELLRELACHAAATHPYMIAAHKGTAVALPAGIGDQEEVAGEDDFQSCSSSDRAAAAMIGEWQAALLPLASHGLMSMRHDDLALEAGGRLWMATLGAGQHASVSGTDPWVAQAAAAAAAAGRVAARLQACWREQQRLLAGDVALHEAYTEVLEWALPEEADEQMPVVGAAAAARVRAAAAALRSGLAAAQPEGPSVPPPWACPAPWGWGCRQTG